MNTQRRQQYMAAIGLESWRPRTVLPGAAPSILVRRRVLVNASQAQGGAARTAGQHPKQAQQTANASKNVSDIRSSLIDPPQQARTAPAPERTGAEPARHANEAAPTATNISTQENTPSKAGVMRSVRLFILNCPGKLLIVDEGHRSREQEHLLRNIAAALHVGEQLNFIGQEFAWSPGRSASDQPADMLFGMLHRAISRDNCNRVLLMGDGPMQQVASQVEGAIKGASLPLPQFGDDVQCVLTHSSEELLKKPILKADTWQHIQHLID